MDLAMVGLGRMGGNMARRLLRGGHRVVVWNRTYAKAEELGAEGAEPVRELADVVGRAAGAARHLAHAALRRPDAGGHRRARAAARRGRHPHRRRQLALPARHRARRRARRAGPALPRRRHQRRRVGPRGRLLPHGRRRALGLRPHRAAPQDAGAARPRLRVLRRPRLRALRQDGPQRHRVRHDAGLRRGLRAARGHRLGPRPRRHRRPVEPGQRGAQLAARAGRRRLQEGPRPGAASPGYVEDTGEGRWTVEQAIQHSVPMPAIAAACSCASARARTTRSPARCWPRCATSSAATPCRRRSERRADLPRYRDEAPEPHIGYEDADRFGDDDGLRVGGLPRARRGALAVRRRARPRPLQPRHLRRHRRPHAPQAHPGALRPRLSRRAARPAPRSSATAARSWTTTSCATCMREAIDDHYGEEVVDGAACERILRTPRYVHGEFDEPEGYRRLAADARRARPRSGTRGNRMFYLATPPSQFEPIIKRRWARPGWRAAAPATREHGQGEPVPGWTRIVIEKPFGRDLATAPRAQRVIGERLRRAAGLPHRPLPGQGDRAEPAGAALRQRHLRAGLEPALRRPRADHRRRDAGRRAPRPVLRGGRRAARHDPAAPHAAVLAGRHGAAGGLRRRRACATRSSRCCAPCGPSRATGSTQFAVRGQYVAGHRRRARQVPAYREEERVAPDSHTETYAAVKLLVDNWRWQGVPFYLRTGKRMAAARHRDRHPVQAAAGAASSATSARRRRCGPTCWCCACSPTRASRCASSPRCRGTASTLQPVAMDYSYGTTLHELPFSAYETLLVDAMEGDMTLFNRGDQVEEAWRIVEPDPRGVAAASRPRDPDLRGRQLGAGGGRRR